MHRGRKRVHAGRGYARSRPPSRSRRCALACDLTLGMLDWPSTEVGGRLVLMVGRSGGFRGGGPLLPGFLGGLLTAGWRRAGPERRSLGRPGERPEGFGAAAGEPSAARSRRNPRRTRTGDSRGWDRGRSHGSRWSATSWRATRSWVEAASTSQVRLARQLVDDQRLPWERPTTATAPSA